MTKARNLMHRFQKRSTNSNHVHLKERQEKSPVPKRKSRQKLVSLRSFQEKFSRYTGEKLTGLQVLFRLGDTVLHAILPWVLLCAGYAALTSLLHQLGYLSAVHENKALPHVAVALNIALSLLLVFRTNAAHERFWEGRKLWGSMVNTVRNCVRSIWISVEERLPHDRTQKEDSMRLVAAFAVAMKLHLRRDPMSLNDELAPLMSLPQYRRLQEVNHGPLEIAFWLEDYVQQQYEHRQINGFQLQDLHKMLNDLVDILGGCERILKTPVPLAYTMTLKILLVAYFIIVPLELVDNLHWWVSPATAFISLIFLSIQEVSSEIEEPFGHDPNDLPLDFICDTIKRNVEDLIQHAPSSRNIVEWPRASSSIVN
ncbi:bestrophin family protein [Phormidesmis sp. 146-12]